MRMAGKPEEITGSIESYTNLARGFDGTLTEVERRAVIPGLEQDGERQTRLP